MIKNLSILKSSAIIGGLGALSTLGALSSGIFGKSAHTGPVLKIENSYTKKVNHADVSLVSVSSAGEKREITTREQLKKLKETNPNLYVLCDFTPDLEYFVKEKKLLNEDPLRLRCFASEPIGQVPKKETKSQQTQSDTSVQVPSTGTSS